MTVSRGSRLTPALVDRFSQRDLARRLGIGMPFVTVDADTLKSLRTSAGGQITVAAPNNTQPVTIPFSLKGFSDGFNVLEREHARRTGLFRFFARS